MLQSFFYNLEGLILSIFRTEVKFERRLKCFNEIFALIYTFFNSHLSRTTILASDKKNCYGFPNYELFFKVRSHYVSILFNFQIS